MLNNHYDIFVTAQKSYLIYFFGMHTDICLVAAPLGQMQTCFLLRRTMNVEPDSGVRCYVQVTRTSWFRRQTRRRWKAVVSS